ncbi:MAG TPA: hypothetical protein DCG69_05165 [Bacteroidales bacterium]|nr:hypothetical protein [Bacteroidales bacterium]
MHRQYNFGNWWFQKKNFFLILTILFSFSVNTYSQQALTSFPEDSVLFISALEQHFQVVQSSKKEEAEKFMLDLKLNWSSGLFSREIKTEVYKTANKMLAKKMAAMPYFSDYFTSLTHLLQSNSIGVESKIAWTKSVQFVVLNKSLKEFSTFIKSSDALFTENLVYSDRTLKWKVSTSDYSIQFNKDSLSYIFPNTNLSCYTKGDSTNINNTSGVYFPLSNRWYGKGGSLSWERANYSADSVYAKLSSYSIPLLYDKFTADSVQLYHLYYFDKPIAGKIEEQILASRRGNKALFPKFISYDKRWEIPNLFPNIDFIGGILIEGAKFIGFGDETNPASLLIKRKDTVFVKLKSHNFHIQPNQILSEYTSLSIIHGNDSIYHSGLHMNYTKDNQMLSFVSDAHGLTANPFYNTYHQLDMYVEAAYWDMKKDEISFDIAKGRTKSPARFESFTYFSEARFEKLQGLDYENPLIGLKRYSDENRSNIVYFDEYAHYLRMPKEQVQLLLLNLAHQGFLIYDEVNQRAVLGDKIDFYLKANAGEIDSDVIRFESRPEKDQANASLQIDNFTLRINGLDRVILSDSQNLIIEPKNRSILLEKNKNFRFDGKITAGRLSFSTTQSAFSYDEFKLDMPVIDSMWFWVQGKALPEGGYEKKFVQTAIRNLSGDLLIDHPSNKSGLEARTEYPIFNSKKDSYVYYNKKTIQNGVYTKDKFYFHVNPFILTSLNNFSTDDIAFNGYLASGGIFPDIAQALTVQEDFSLGFKKALPPEGIMAYGNKGKFYNEINLSNKGLKGSGQLSFLSSVSSSDDFTFLPESTLIYAQIFEIKPTISPVEFPNVRGTNVFQKWLPYEETMHISSQTENIKMYDEETSLKGTLILKPTSLSGNGTIQFKVASMISDTYVFKNQNFDAQKTNFSDVGMSLNNFSAHADYKLRNVTFSSNDGTSKVDFPENQFICYMNQAKWYMDESVTEYASNFKDSQDNYSEFTLRQLADTEYKGSRFISTHPQQDSLTFVSSHAKFNSKEKVIEANGVHFIKVADAVLFPKNSTVTILKNANIQTFEDSKILANAVTKYHELDHANVKINGRKSYAGSGDYLYIDKNHLRHSIHFEEIKIDTNLQTVASGEIFAKDNFALSPEFFFRGVANLSASQKLLSFDGGFRIENECGFSQNWIKFNSAIDPENIMIPIDVQPIVPDVSKQQKFVGLLNSPARQKTYAAFLSNKIDYYDSVLFTASGFLKFDESTREFRISSQEKLNQMTRPDNFFSLRTNDCSTFGEGEIELDLKYLDLKLKSYGTIEQKDSVSLIRLGAAIDFHFSNDALRIISEQFVENSPTAVDNTSNYYSKMIGGFLGMNEAEQYLSRLLMSNQKRVHDQLIHSLFLSDVKLSWDAKQNAYLSEGPIGIGSLDRYRVNSYVNGHLELKKSRTGDELTLYFEVNNQWYFFKYYNNVMQVLSSNSTFNELIKADTEAKGEKNRLAEDKKTGKRSNYRYILSREDEKDDFLKRLNVN